MINEASGRESYFLKVFRSHYCQIVFAASLIVGYFIIPGQVFHGYYSLLGAAFIISFGSVLTCLIRQTKEKIKLAKMYSGAVAGIIATAIGLAALESCGIGAPVCGAMMGLGFLSVIFPISSVNFIAKYSIAIVSISILTQLISLYFMNCFRKVNKLTPH